MVKKAKKRGRKPGVKVGPYKIKTSFTNTAGEGFSTVTGEDYDNATPVNKAYPGEYPNAVPHKTFNDCIFEITNSMMDQNTKAMAFAAMVEAAKARSCKRTLE